MISNNCKRAVFCAGAHCVLRMGENTGSFISYFVSFLRLKLGSSDGHSPESVAGLVSGVLALSA